MDINITQLSGRPDQGEVPLPVKEPKKKKGFKKKLPINPKTVAFFITVIVLLGMAGVSYYLYSQNQQTKQEVLAAQNEIKRLSDTEQVAKDERDALVVKVGALVELPKNETPTVATVADVEKLKNQSFFTDAQNGDKVLIYTKDKTAYLYRPSTNKIITIAPINLNNNNQSQTKTP